VAQLVKDDFTRAGSLLLLPDDLVAYADFGDQADMVTLCTGDVQAFFPEVNCAPNTGIVTVPPPTQ
jgi:hypothetical protein